MCEFKTPRFMHVFSRGGLRLPPKKRAGSGSYWNRLGKNRSPELLRQRFRGHHVHRHAEQLYQLMTNRADVEQRRFGRRVNQNIQVAVLGVIAIHDRAKDAGIASMMGFHHAADILSIDGKGFRWFHGLRAVGPFFAVSPASRSGGRPECSSIFFA